jgi:hypothetical protein
MRATATLWAEGVATWSSTYETPAGLERTAVGDGWTLDVLPSEPVPGGAGTLVAQVDLVADDAGVLVPLTLTAHVQR